VLQKIEHFLVEAILSYVKYIHFAVEEDAFLEKLNAWDGSQYAVQPASV
jgi:hypothetical protein